MGNVFLIDSLKPIETRTRRGYFVPLSPKTLGKTFEVNSSFRIRHLPTICFFDLLIVFFPIFKGPIDIIVKNNLFVQTFRVNIQVVSSISKLSIIDANSTLVINTNHQFRVNYVSLGEPSCAVVKLVTAFYANTLGSFGTSQSACNSFFPNVNFVSPYSFNANSEWTFNALMTRIGNVEVSIEMRNSISSEKVKANISVSNSLSCQSPILSIENRAELFYKPVQFKRSEQFTLKGVANFNCNDTLSNTKQWFIYQIDPQTGSVRQQVYLFNNPTVNYAELVVEPNSLPIGLYKVVYNVKIELSVKIAWRSTIGNIFTSELDTYVQIVRSGIVVSSLPNTIGGGTVSITRGTKQSIVFNPALYSYDLDNLIAMSSLKFNFYCQVIDDGIENEYPMLFENVKADLYSLKFDPLLNLIPMSSNKTCFESNGTFFEHSSF